MYSSFLDGPPWTGNLLAKRRLAERAAILTESVAALHERWAEPAKCMHDTERAGDGTTKARSSATLPDV